MTKRQKQALKEKVKVILGIIVFLICYAYVSNSDFETLKLECQAGLRVCEAAANQ